MNSFYDTCWLLAVQIGPGGEASSEVAEKAGEESGGGMFDGLEFFIPAMLVVLVLYFMLMNRPQKKEDAASAEKLSNLKKNDRIVTAGGIIGTIVNNQTDTDYVTIRIDESSNTKMKILRKSVVRVIKDDDTKD